MITIDGRCPCIACQRRTDRTYSMSGICYNCGTKDFMIMYRVGDKATSATCPVCENWRSVHPQQLAISTT